MALHTCANGHLVEGTDLLSCPQCGEFLSLATDRQVRRLMAQGQQVVTPDPTPTEALRSTPGSQPVQPWSRRTLPGASRSWGWAIAGTILTAIGAILLAQGTNDGPRAFGAVLIALGQVAVLIGAIGIGVFNGMLDLHDRQRAENQLPDSAASS